jgi:hypothetical protein
MTLQLINRMDNSDWPSAGRSSSVIAFRYDPASLCSKFLIDQHLDLDIIRQILFREIIHQIEFFNFIE